MRQFRRRQNYLALSGMFAVVSLLLASAGVYAQETVRVGIPVPDAFSFVPLDVGVAKGIFVAKKITLEKTVFAGDAKMQQAAAADGIDILVGSGPAMAFIEKGSPIKAIAAVAGPPLLLVLLVRNDGSINTVEGLKGKRVGAHTTGSLTYWTVLEIARQQGWGPKGMTATPLGTTQAQIIALKRGDIDGMITDLSTALMSEKAGEGKIILRVGDIVKDFYIHVAYATDKLISGRPEAVRGFLSGWFESVKFMRENRTEAIRIAQQSMSKDTDIATRSYDELMPMFTDTGKFSPKPLDVLSRSFVELGTLPEQPNMQKLFTEAFLPQ
jgi:NitT/TauT family transport system substrate-binding protein